MLRLLVREAEAVVEGQAVVDLPVVLHVELGVVVDHAAFDELRRLQVLGEDASRRVGEAEARVERIVGVVAEVDVALERQVGDAAGAGVLRLEAVVVVEAALERVAAGNLRHADGDVLRAVDVQPTGIPLTWHRRRRAVPRCPGRGCPNRSSAAGSLACRPTRAEPRLRAPRTHRSSSESTPSVRVEHREARHRGQAVRRIVDEHAVLVAAGQLVADEAVSAFDEGRRVQRVVGRERVVGDVGVRR